MLLVVVVLLVMEASSLGSFVAPSSTSSPSTPSSLASPSFFLLLIVGRILPRIKLLGSIVFLLVIGVFQVLTFQRVARGIEPIVIFFFPLIVISVASSLATASSSLAPPSRFLVEDLSSSLPSILSFPFLLRVMVLVLRLCPLHNVFALRLLLFKMVLIMTSFSV
mmetsp:Transcript_15126/g.14708  ORF Transcript_15126/g.14708 Transcript_15126/m.14708 type:complete len:165 (+) Transcript_15126:63-557(+)